MDKCVSGRWQYSLVNLTGCSLTPSEEELVGRVCWCDSGIVSALSRLNREQDGRRELRSTAIIRDGWPLLSEGTWSSQPEENERRSGAGLVSQPARWRGAGRVVCRGRRGCCRRPWSPEEETEVEPSGEPGRPPETHAHRAAEAAHSEEKQGKDG